MMPKKLTNGGVLAARQRLAVGSAINPLFCTKTDSIRHQPMWRDTESAQTDMEN